MLARVSLRRALDCSQRRFWSCQRLFVQLPIITAPSVSQQYCSDTSLSKSHTLSKVNWILKTNIKFHRYNRSLKIFLSSEQAANCVSLNGSGRMKLPCVCIIILQTIDRNVWQVEEICHILLVDMRRGREHFKIQTNLKCD